MKRIDSPDGRLYEYQGRLYPAVSSVLKLMESPFLQRDWPVRKAVRAAIDNPDAGQDELIEMVLADMDEASQWGTQFHGYMDATLSGHEWEGDTMPTRVKNLVKSVQGWMQENEILPLACEVGVVNITHGYAGTADLYGIVNGKRLCIDYKTGKDVWGEAQLQLTAYRRAEYIPDVPDVPGYTIDNKVPQTEGAAVLHVRPRSCKLIPLQTGQDQWTAFLYMLECWRIARRYHRKLTA